MRAFWWCFHLAGFLGITGSLLTLGWLALFLASIYISV